MLSQAAEALDRREPVVALQLLLEAWRAQPARPLARAVSEVGRWAMEATKPPRVSRNALAERQSPVDVPRLVDGFFGVSVAVASERFALLSTWPPDPRLAELVSAWIAIPPFVDGDSLPFWSQVCAYVERSREPRLIEVIARAPAAFATAFHHRTRADGILAQLASAASGLTTQFPNGAPQLSADDLAICDRIFAHCAAEKAAARTRVEDEKAFLSRIYADPSDDATRQVYGDWLQQLNDPRGELIALGFARQRGAPNEARERVLLREHGTDWLGPLARVIARKTMCFERGFLAACVLDGKPSSEALQSTIGNALWSTVERIEVGHPSPDAGTLRALIQHPVMRALRELVGINLEVATPLIRQGASALHTLGIVASHGDREAIATALANGALPNLRHLEWTESLSAPRVAGFLSGSHAANLESLTIKGVSSKAAIALTRSERRWTYALVVPAEYMGVEELHAAMFTIGIAPK